jgi:hypothetical protein
MTINCDTEDGLEWIMFRFKLPPLSMIAYVRIRRVNVNSQILDWLDQSVCSSLAAR